MGVEWKIQAILHTHTTNFSYHLSGYTWGEQEGKKIKAIYVASQVSQAKLGVL